MRRAAAEAHADAAWVDDRLTGEPRPHRKPPRPAASLQIAKVLLVLAACWFVGVQDLIFAAFTTVRCGEGAGPVAAGSNVTCVVSTSRLSSEADLSITQLGLAGPIVMLSSTGHTHTISFATGPAGRAGVRVSHAVFWTSAMVDVAAGPAAPGHVEVSCSPPSVPLGKEVRCAVTPRDRWGSAAEVVRPEGAPPGYFAVSKVGGARELAVHDSYVAFVAAEAGRAGVAVTLGGVRAESVVDVLPAAGALKV